MEPASTEQRVCYHPAQIILLQKDITDLKSQQFLPPKCNHTTIENQIWTVIAELDEARLRRTTPGTDEELR